MQAVKWGEFKVEDVLDWMPQKEIDPLKLKFLTIEGTEKYPFYGQSTTNNGVISYETLTEDVLNNKDGLPTILVHSNNQNVVYVETPFYLKDGHGATSVLQSAKLNKANAMFLMSAISKVIVQKFSYQEKATKIALKNTFIQLPITSNNEIDFDFMESFIRELEEERIRELSAYLTVSGLADATLTANERYALECFDKLEWKEFNVTDVFNVKNTHNILSSEIAENSGGVPYLCASAENNGVSSYISYNADFLEDGNCIFIGGKTFVVSYQKYDFFSNDSHNLALYLKDCEAEKSNQLYLATCIRKSLAHKYSWGNSISNAKIKGDKVMLPVRDGAPDYAAMQDFISAVQKLVIKDVVKYAEDKINATKKVVKNKNEYKTNEDKSFLMVAESADYKGSLR